MSHVIESESAAADPAAADGPSFSLTAQQLKFFDTFGFLRIPGLFADDIDDITAAFESVFGAKSFLQYVAQLTGTDPAALGEVQPTGEAATDPAWFETSFELHFGRSRVTVPDIARRHEVLAAVERDPRMVQTVESILGKGFETKPADGNLFYCDTSWHADIYGSPLEEYHLKLSFYLDPLDGDSGAIRLLPGTNDYTSAYASSLRGLLWSPATIAESLGIEADEIPSYTLCSEPGDAVLWNYRVIHASFNGRDRRRLLSFNFRESPHAAEAATA